MKAGAPGKHMALQQSQLVIGPIDFSSGSEVKHLPKCGRPGFDPWVGEILWRRKWQPTPVLLPGKIPWTEEPSRLQFMGSQRVGHD